MESEDVMKITLFDKRFAKTVWVPDYTEPKEPEFLRRKT